MILREDQHVASPGKLCMEIKVRYAVTKIDGKDRVYGWKKRQERGRMCEGYQFFIFMGRFPPFLWGVKVR